MMNLRTSRPVAAVFSLVLASPTFAQGFPTVVLPPGSTVITAGDMNGDGHPDLIAANVKYHKVSVRLGDGAGGFATANAFSLGTKATSVGVVTGDFNNDGNLDVAVSGNYVLLGDGLGGLGAPLFADPKTSMSSLAAFDVNQDGKLDLMTGAQTYISYIPGVPPILTFLPGGFEIQLGNGLGGFAAPQLVTMGASYSIFQGVFTSELLVIQLEWGDLNGDGLLDPVGNVSGFETGFGLYASQYVAGRIALGGGAFQAESLTQIEVAAYPSSLTSAKLAVGDISGDGRADVVVGTGKTWLSYGSGTFAAGPSLPNKATGTPQMMWLTDMSGDGIAEAFCDNPSDDAGRLTMWKGNTGAAFAQPADVLLPGSVLSVVACDLNGVGRQDALVLCANNTVCTLLGNGSGGFEGPAALASPTASQVGFGGGMATLSVDVNEDGLRDLIAGTASSIYVAFGTGGGAFAGGSTILSGPALTGCAAADFDRDGHVDLAVIDASQSRITVLAGDGTGAFVVFGTMPTDAAPVDVAAGDLSGDGRPDLVTANYGGNTISVLLAAHSGFAPHVDSLSDTGPCAVAIGDMNGDGIPDVVDANYQSSTVCVYLGAGGGSLGTKTSFACTPGPAALDLGDVNGDGVLDVLVAGTSSSPGYLSIQLGNGSGGLGAKSDTKCVTPGNIRLADLNGDGRLDAIAARAANTTPSSLGYADVMIGVGAGGFLPTASFPMIPSVAKQHRLAVADLDSDGRLDLVSTADSDTKAYVRLNATGAPFGMLASGSGTHGCAGVHGIAANIAAKIGKPGFSVACTNAPPSSLGLAIVTDLASAGGVDPFGLGVVFYVDLLNANYVNAIDIVSDRNGYAVASEPIPALPVFAGVTVHTQVFWAWFDGCAPSQFALSSSRVLATTFQP
jgi:hypothetical protein